MKLFGSKELLFCTSFRFLCGIIALKMNWWYDRKSLLRCHSNTSLYSHLLGQTVIRLRHVQTVCWRLCKQLHDSITNMTMTANELMTSCHSQMCVFSEWKILYYLKRVFLNIPHTNSLTFYINIKCLSNTYGTFCTIFCYINVPNNFLHIFYLRLNGKK